MPELPTSLKPVIYSLIYFEAVLGDLNGMGLDLPLMLQLLKLCIIGFAVTAQGSKESNALLSVGKFLDSAKLMHSFLYCYWFMIVNPLSDLLYPCLQLTYMYIIPLALQQCQMVLPFVKSIKLSYDHLTNGLDFHDPGPFFQPLKTLPLPTAAPSPHKIKDIESSNSPPYGFVPSQSVVQGNKPPSVKTSAPQTKAPGVSPPVSTPTAPAPVAIYSGRSPKSSPVSQPIEHGNLTPNVDRRSANKSHLAQPFSLAPIAVALPNESPVSQSPEHASFPSSVSVNMGHNLKPVPASTDLKSYLLLYYFIFAPNVHKSNTNKGLPSDPVSLGSTDSVASPPWKVENNPPESHPIVPTITPSILPAPVTSPPNAFPLKPPLVHPIVPVAFPSKLPAPLASPTPLRIINWKEGGAPVVAPLLRNPKPLPAVIPAQGSSFSPFPSPIRSNMGQISPVPSPPIKHASHTTGIPASESSSKRPKMPLLPQVQALPPPPTNEDYQSIVCTEPYTNSRPGEPCICVWPMRVGLRLSVSLYTFFPLVSELASEIATGVFMKQSQVRIIGANEANQQPEKTVVLIDLVPLGERFDNTTAFFTSDRFWHKKVLLKAFYFGDYDVLYVSYPGLPPSPPSNLNMFNGGPYSNDGNNGGTIKPLGVDIQKRQHKGGLTRGIISIIAVSVCLAVVLCAAAAWVMFKFRDHVSQPASTPRKLSPSSLTKESGTAGSCRGGRVGSISTSFRSSIAAYTGSAKTFSTNDIEKATCNFLASRILGEGGFGLVYSGILEDGTKVAVKVLKREDQHGDREFLAEVEMLGRLHHRNLVKLIGICIEDSFRCLVYELIPNGSVESHLHGVDKENGTLDWGARMKIALGAARVTYFNYVAPEYAMTGHLLVKSDVYSYGVVLLELLTGRKPVDMSQAPGQENLVGWARPLLTSKEGCEAMIDPSLEADVPFDSVAKVAAIASMCVQPEVSNRPFMGEVVQALKLVCNECDAAKEEAGSRSSSLEDLSVDLDLGISTLSGHLSDNFQSQFSATNFESGVDIERGLAASELFSSSARFGWVGSGSYRRNSYSGPLRTRRSRGLWQIIRSLSSGSISEHGTMLKL
ncbi:hypothetical protein VNO78_23004 [Psophocarpus tetragonolobus]|uniref:Protein kinase domain-containing protein n=1 Tax=Psophocarpus tetragonolobus TaxID=3891 RepID=A0AAN9S2I8_PSOTE